MSPDMSPQYIAEVIGPLPNPDDPPLVSYRGRLSHPNLTVVESWGRHPQVVWTCEHRHLSGDTALRCAVLQRDLWSREPGKEGDPAQQLVEITTADGRTFRYAEPAALPVRDFAPGGIVRPEADLLYITRIHTARMQELAARRAAQSLPPAPKLAPEPPTRDRSWLSTELINATPRQQRAHRLAEDARNTPNLYMDGETLYRAGEPAHYHTMPMTTTDEESTP